MVAFVFFRGDITSKQAGFVGGQMVKVTWTPSDYPEVASVLSEIKWAVKTAIAKPYEITDLK